MDTTIQATADAPPMEIEESKIPISDIVAKLLELSSGQKILYRPTGLHQQNMDLFVIAVKEHLYTTSGQFSLVQTTNGVILRKE